MDVPAGPMPLYTMRENGMRWRISIVPEMVMKRLFVPTTRSTSVYCDSGVKLRR